MQIIKFDAVSLMLNPFVLMFVTIALGLLFGKVKFGMFSFGTSGALFVGLIVGWSIYGFAQKIYDAGDETAAGFKAAAQIMSGNGGKVIHTYFFSAALIVFVAAVGLLAAKDLGIVLKKYGAKFVVLGLLITFIGAGATYACTAFCKGTNQYAVTGVYTGAMTSSPGLASALETAELQATDLANHYEQESAHLGVDMQFDTPAVLPGILAVDCAVGLFEILEHDRIHILKGIPLHLAAQLDPVTGFKQFIDFLPFVLADERLGADRRLVVSDQQRDEIIPALDDAL